MNIPIPVVLAVVAALGCFFGRRWRRPVEDAAAQSRRELCRVRAVARELEKIAQTLRESLARHNSSVSRFRYRLSQLGSQQGEGAWEDLCREADEVLKPTLQLATQIAGACDRIRQQTDHLMTFTQRRTDPLTGVGNRRGLEQVLESQFATMTRYETTFSLVIFEIDHFQQIGDGRLDPGGDRILRRVAALLEQEARETDTVARFGGEKLIVVMPQIDLQGACAFGERMRAAVERQLPVTVSGGVAVALDGDSPDSLLARADAALYGAKSAGRNCVFRHNGEQIESVLEPAPAGEPGATW